VSAEGTATALGFEVAAELPGIARLPPATDKDVLFLIDVSGSMSGRRIQSATDNALNVFNRFTNADDHVGLYWFHHNVQTKLALAPRRETQRRAIDSTRKPDFGGTAFYDALIQVCREAKPKSSNSYLVALTDGADMDSKASIGQAMAALEASPFTLLLIGLEVNGTVRAKCERLTASSPGGMYLHAADAGAGLDEAFARVAAQFVLPTVKSADAAASGGGARGV